MLIYVNKMGPKSYRDFIRIVVFGYDSLTRTDCTQIFIGTDH